MQKYPSNHAEKLKNKFAKRFAAIGSISDASLVYEHILKSGRTNVAGVWYSSFEESAIPWTVPNKVLKKRKARALDVDPSEVAETTMQGNSTSDVATADLKCRFASACYDLERTGIVKCRASENNTITVTRTAYGFIE